MNEELNRMRQLAGIQEDDQVNENRNDVGVIVSNIMSACDRIKERFEYDSKSLDGDKATNPAKLRKILEDLELIDDNVMIELEQNLPGSEENKYQPWLRRP